MTSNHGPSMRLFSVCVSVALALAFSACPRDPEPLPDPDPAPVIDSFTASAAIVEPGQAVTLSWKTTHATRVELTDAELGVVSGVSPEQAEGSVEVTVASDKLYVLTATNPRGVRDTAVVVVQAKGVGARVMFVSSPTEISAGEDVVLAWSAAEAKSVTLESVPGGPLDITGMAEHGTLTHNPTVSTLYRLTVDGAIYESEVAVLPTLGEVVAQPSPVKPGDMLTISWTTVGATRVIVTGAGRGVLLEVTDPAQVAAGSLMQTVPADVDPAGVLSYEVRAENGDGTGVERTVQVYVAGAPSVQEFIAPRYVPAGGSFKVSWKTTGADVVEITLDGTVVFRSGSLEQAKTGGTTFPSPAKESTYVLRALDSRGAVASSEPKLVDPVGAPTVMSFTATPQPGVASGGDVVTLTWNVPSARNLRITAVGGSEIVSLTGKAAEMGTFPAYPNKNTTYLLEADNALGVSVTDTEDVTVQTPATLIFSPSIAPAGASVSVTTTVPMGGDLEGLLVKNAPGAAFVDISTTGTNIGYTGTDSTPKLVTLPQTFSTRLFGKPVSGNKLSVSINGWFAIRNSTFTGPDSPTAFPTQVLVPFAIAPFYADLYNVAASDIYYQLDEVAQETRLIVQWEQVEYDAKTGSVVTIQAQVFSGGRVVFAYKTLQGVTGSNPSIGVINADETGAVAAPAGLIPNEGDTYTLFARVPVPATMLATGAPVNVRQYIGTQGAFIDLTGQMTIIPPNQFRVSEVNVAPAAGVTDGQWFEVENLTSSSFDLSGWTVDFGGTSHVLPQGTILAASSRMVFAQSMGAGDGVSVDYIYPNTLVIPQGGTVSVGLSGAKYASMALPPASLAPGRTWQVGGKAAGFTTVTGVTELACPSKLSSAYGSNGQTGTPGAANTTCPSWAAPTVIPALFEPIALTGTKLTFVPSNDEGAAVINLPDPINLGGAQYSEVTVGSNGWLAIGTVVCPSSFNCYYLNKTTPSTSDPRGLVAVYWADLNATSLTGSGVYWQRKVPGVSANDGYTLVSWERITYFGESDDLNFQVKFFDTGVIEYHFGIFSGENGLDSTTWLEDPSGAGAFIINANSSSSPGIASNKAWRFAAQ